MKKFIIDTNSYAGNFERELCAYVTGAISECGVGQEFVQDDFKVEGVVEGYDENGYLKVCKIYSNPRYFNDGRGNHYVDDGVSCKNVKLYKNIKWPAYMSVAINFEEGTLTDELIDIMKKRAYAFCYSDENLLQFTSFDFEIEGFRVETVAAIKEVVDV